MTKGDAGPLPPTSPPVTRAEVLEVSLPLMEPFVTGFGSTDTRRTILVHLLDADGAEGWGEAAALDHPFYLPDTTSASMAVICEWALPIALEAGPDPLEVARAMSAIRGNTFARAGVESAFWCLEASRREMALATLFSQHAGGRAAPAEAALRRAVPVGESIGIHASLASTLDEVDPPAR